MLHHRTRSKCQCPATQDRRQLGQGPACQHVCYAENPSHHEVQGASKTWRANFYPPKWTNYDKFRIWKHPFHTSSPISNRKIPGSMRIWPGGQQGAIWAPSLTGCRFNHQLYPYTLVYILISIPSIPYILICMGESSQSLLLKVLILGWLLTPSPYIIPIHTPICADSIPLSNSPKIQVLLRHVETSPSRLEQALSSPSLIAPGKKGRSHQEEPEAVDGPNHWKIGSWRMLEQQKKC